MFLLSWMISAVIWLVLLPLIWLTLTPVFLVVALRGSGGYLEELGRRYEGVTDFWRRYGELVAP